MRSSDAINAPEALVLTMVLVSAADGGMTDREIGIMSGLVQTLPASSYILAANIMAYAVPGALVWLSMKLGDGLQAKLRAQGRLASDGAAS